MAVSPQAVAGSAANAQAAAAAQTKAVAALQKAIGKVKGVGGVNSGLLGSGQAQSALDQLKSFVSSAPGANILVNSIDQVERPAQAILHGIEGRNNGASGILHGIMAGLAGGNNGFQFTPNNEINLGQAVGAPMFEKAGYTQQQAEQQTGNMGGNLGGVLNFAGGTALDPLTYVTAGVGGVAKAGLRAVAATEAGTEAATRIAASGAKSLAPEEAAGLRTQLSTLDTAKQWAAQNAGKTPEDYANKVMKDLHEPTGIKFMGKTVASYAPAKAAAGAVAEKTGLASAGRAVAESEIGQAAKGLGQAAKGLGQAAVNTVKVGAPIAREVGEGARNAVQRVKGAAQHLVGIDQADMGRQAKAAINQVQNPGDFLKTIVGPALETNTVDEKAAELRSAGQEPEAHLLETFRNVYQHGLTKQRLAAGIVRPSQLHDMNTHMPMIPTDEARKYIEEHPAEAEKLGYKQQANGVLRNAEPAFRKLKLDTVADRNKYMAEKTGVPEFFHTDPVKAYSRFAEQTSHDAVTASILDGLTREKFEGKPLAIKEPDLKTKTDSIKANHKQDTKELKSRAKALGKQVDKSENKKLAVHAAKSKLAEASVNAARKAVQTAEDKVASARNKAIAAGVERRTARTMGKHSIFEGDEFVSEKTNTAPSAQQRIGRAQSSAKFLGQQQAKAEQELASAKSNLERLAARASKLKESAPKSSKDELAETETTLRELNAGKKERLAAAEARGKVNVPDGYVKVDAGPKGVYWMPKAIAQHVMELDKFTGSEEGTRALGKAFSGLQAAWKNIQLNFGPLAIARIERDAMSNMIQMAEKGFTNRGSAYQRAWKITSVLRKLPPVGSDVAKRDAALREAGLDEKDIDIVRQMDREGAWAGGRYSGGELQHTNALLDARGKAIRVLDVRKAEGPLTKPAEAVNDFSDKFSRTAMFIDQYTKHGDAREAANAVDEALFNYNDLTKQEQNVRKYAMAFYTFTKKNAVLQAWAATHNPRALAILERARESAMSASNSKNPIPEYALAQGELPIGSIGGTQILSGLETPDLAAASALQPFADIASALPGTPRSTRTVAGIQGGAQGLLGNFSGVAPNLLEQLASEAAGTSLYTGAPNQTTDTGELKQLAGAFIPRYNASQTTISNATGDKANQAQAILKLLGMPSIANTPQKQASTLKGETADINAELKAEGITNNKQLAAARLAKAKSKAK